MQPQAKIAAESRECLTAVHASALADQHLFDPTGWRHDNGHGNDWRGNNGNNGWRGHDNNGRGNDGHGNNGRGNDWRGNNDRRVADDHHQDRPSANMGAPGSLGPQDNFHSSQQ